MKIVISPAKSIDMTRSYPKTTYTVAEFLPDAEKLIKKLKKLNAKKIQKLMNVSEDISELNFKRFQNWVSPTEPSEQAIPAMYAFTGEVYRGLDAQTMSEKEILFAQENLRILSGLYGLLRPLDLMYPYRLEMGTKYEVTAVLKNLYMYWGIKPAQYFNINMQNEEVLINLASNEYFKAIDLKTLRAKVITPVFMELKGDKYKIVMMHAKNARGKMARYIIENQITNPEDLKLFNKDSYSFDVNQSTDTEWVFTR
jgi:uncharacterized protein